MSFPAMDGARPLAAEGMPQVVLRGRGLSRAYASTQSGSGMGTELILFRDLHLEVAAAEMVAIVGRSGAGKSSLLHLLAGLDQPTSGEVWIGGTLLTSLPVAAAATLRNRSIGFVWQFHYLLPEFSALENVALPLLARGEPRRNAMRQAHSWLQRVELGERAYHRGGELSGGEQQRVAIARALVNDPLILLADEPTGDLDERTASGLFDLLQRLCREQGLAAVLVTHNAEMARRCDRTLQLQDGRLVP